MTTKTIFKIAPGWTGRPKNTEFYGKQTVTALYFPIFQSQFNPYTFSVQEQFEKYVSLIGKDLDLPRKRTLKRVMGVGKDIVASGFGGTPCVEVYIRK